jgi:hypothetical protein
MIPEIMRTNLKIMEHGFFAERPILGSILTDSPEGEVFETYGQISNLGLSRFNIVIDFRILLICKIKIRCDLRVLVWGVGSYPPPLFLCINIPIKLY